MTSIKIKYYFFISYFLKNIEGFHVHRSFFTVTFKGSPFDVQRQGTSLFVWKDREEDDYDPCVSIEFSTRDNAVHINNILYFDLSRQKCAADGRSGTLYMELTMELIHAENEKYNYAHCVLEDVSNVLFIKSFGEEMFFTAADVPWYLGRPLCAIRTFEGKPTFYNF